MTLLPEYTWKELADMDAGEQFNVPNLAPKGGMTIIHSAPKRGKSLLIWSALAELHQTGTWWGDEVPIPPLVHLWTEEPLSMIQQKMQQVRFPVEAAGRALPSVFRQAEHQNWERLLYDAAVSWGNEAPDVLVIDTLGHFAMGKRDVSDYGESIDVLGTLRRTVQAAKPDMSILLMHHSRKAAGQSVESALGSTALAGMVDAILEFDRVDVDPNWRVLKGDTRWGGEYEKMLSWEEGIGRYTVRERVTSRSAIHQALDEGLAMTVTELVEHVLGQTGRTITRQAIQKIINGDQDIIQDGKRGQATLYAARV